MSLVKTGSEFQICWPKTSHGQASHQLSWKISSTNCLCTPRHMAGGEHEKNHQFFHSVEAKGFPGGSDGKDSTCNGEDPGVIFGWEESLEKGTATHSSVLAWRIPWTEEPCGLQRVGHNWANFHYHSDQWEGIWLGKMSHCFFFLKKIIFILGGSLRCCTWTFSSCSKQGPLSGCCMLTSYCCGFSYCGAWTLGHMGSVVVVPGL